MVAQPLAPAPTAPRFQEDGAGLSREQLIDRIQTLNPTASPDYLVLFAEGALEIYLEHLIVTSQPRGRATGWLRPGDTPAILRFVPPDEG